MTARLISVFCAAVLLAGLSPGGRAQAPARDAGYAYLSPVPGAPYCAPDTRFILARFTDTSPSNVTNLALGFITVTGTRTGMHAGKTRVASDGRTVTFEIGNDFAEDELITVSLNPQVRAGTAGTVAPYSYAFMVGGPMPGPPQGARAPSPPNPVVPAPAQAAQTRAALGSATSEPRKAAVILANGVAVPGDFPKVTVSVNNRPAPGCLFLENGIDVPPFTMILDNAGSVLWYRQGRMYDFKVQPNGSITWCTEDGAGFHAFDQNFQYLKTYKTVNGYATDGHELRVFADGTYFMIGYRTNLVDMSRYIEGSTNAIVRETVLQEFTAADELILQWRPWDNYDIRNCGIDFAHLNSIELDDDGHVLVSARQLSEVTKIHRDTGEIIWRLSGEHSSFRFIDDPLNGMSWQHHITALGNGRYLVFDNGNDHSPQVSRAVEYQLDLTEMTGTLAWQYRDTPDRYTHWLGSAQRLTNGNTLINFARPEYPKVVEVDSKGEKRFQLSLSPGSFAYRAFRFPWNGVLAAPYLVVEPQADNVTLIFNRFGDTNVAYYRVYGATSSPPKSVMAITSRPLQQFFQLQNGTRYYFRVASVNRAGVESQFSNQEEITVNIIQPGQNMIKNGDFSNGTGNWEWSVNSAGWARWTVTNGTSRIQILREGDTLSSIQLSQAGCALIQGRTYALEFDAWSDGPRYIELKLGQTTSPFAAYGPKEFPYLTPVKARFKYVFQMEQASDFNATLMFNCGMSLADVFLQNVSLFIVPPGDANSDGRVDVQDLKKLASEWLKPKPSTNVDFDGDGRVDFLDLRILGENWSGNDGKKPTGQQ